MSVIKRIRAAWEALTNAETVSLQDKELLEWLGIGTDGTKKEINEATYYTCLKMLSETMGKLPLKFYQQTERGRIRAAPNRAAHLLATRPNDIMTPATFWATIEYNCEHYGNAYVWMQQSFERQGKYGGNRIFHSFWPMQTSQVQVTMDDDGVFGDKGKLYYTYSDPKTGKQHTFPATDVMHFKTWCTLDGIMGKSVRAMLADAIAGNVDSDSFLRKLYRDGMTSTLTLQYTGDLDPTRRNALRESYEELLSGSKRVRKIIPVPMGMKLAPLDIKLTDAQFFELKKYSALQIAAAFGIKPNQLNNYDKASYSNSEMQQISFLVDTMLYRLAQYEQEVNYKCLTPKEQKDGFFFKFNEKAILRTDSATQMNVLTSAVNNAIYTPNEAREYLDKPMEEGGDVLLCNGNYMPVTMAGAQYQSGGGENANG